MTANKNQNSFSPINLGTIFFGIFIVFVGFYFLANNLDLVPEQFQISLWQLWPLVIIFIGLSFLKVRSLWSAIIGVIVIVVIIGLVAAFLLWGQYNIDDSVVETPINISLEDQADKGEVEIDFGAGNISIGGGADNFVEGVFSSNILSLKEKSYLDNGVQKAKLDFDTRWKVFTGRQENNLDLSLNNELPLGIYLDTGAATLDMDLSEVNAEIVDINTGASDLDIMMGDLAADAKLNIDAGASSLDIIVPKTVGVDLNIDSGVTSKKFDDFERIGDKQYRSRNYRDVDKFLNIELDLGVSDLKIDWK
jgi:hypothetical protein